MIKEQEIIEKLPQLIRGVFDATGLLNVTGVEPQILELSGTNRPDLVIQVETKEKEKHLIFFEVKSTGQPRYTRMATSQLQSITDKKEKVYGMFCAPFVSEESRQICREAGIGFIDLAGNCLCKFDNIYISFEGKPNPYSTTRPLKFIFGPRSTRALRVLLCNPKKEWLLKNLAREASISIGQSSNLKKRLLEYELIEELGNKKNKGFRLSNPEALLNKWTEEYNYLKNKIKNYYSLEDIKIIESKLINYFEAKQISYAFTLTSGASLIAPFLRYKRVFVYVGDKIEDIAQDLNLKEVSSGPNVSLLEPYDKGIFYGLQKISGVKAVSDVQLYLDLRSYKERGEEAARFILEQRLRKLW